MAGHHFFVDPTDVDAGILTLRGEEAHHAARVLRVRPGEVITASDGSGLVVEATVTSIGDVVEADIRAQRHVEIARPAITLVQAVTKGDRLELVVEKGTEVGIRRFVPFVAERTVVRWDERKLHRVHERLGSIARSSAKQSRAVTVPVVEPIRNGCPPAGPAPTLVLHEEATVRLREALPADPPDELRIVVGPEGGLAPAEVGALSDGGATAVTLGPRILRSETAGVVAAAVVGFAYGWFG